MVVFLTLSADIINDLFCAAMERKGTKIETVPPKQPDRSGVECELEYHLSHGQIRDSAQWALHSAVVIALASSPCLISSVRRLHVAGLPCLVSSLCVILHLSRAYPFHWMMVVRHLHAFASAVPSSTLRRLSSSDRSISLRKCCTVWGLI